MLNPQRLNQRLRQGCETTLKCGSYEVVDLWDLVSVEGGGHDIAVSTDVSVDYPFPLLHVRERLILGEPVDSVASLSPDVGSLLLVYSILVFRLGQQRLSLEVLQIFENLASTALVYSVVHEIVSAVWSVLSGQKNFDSESHRVLRHVSSWLSNNSNILVRSRELLTEHLLNLRSYDIKVVFWMFRAHREAASDIKDIHVLHAFLLCHFENLFGVQNRLSV